MKGQFASRMANIQKSFIREILKITQNPDVISFAGGLPNPQYFPIEAIKAAANKVLTQEGATALQYAPTLGHQRLREWIAQRYAHQVGMTIHPDEILITNGSQQGLDLIGKILLDQGDVVLVESPSYLGGIQALSMYQPEFWSVPLCEDGVDTAVLTDRASHPQAKLFYALPNFQNPTGISYSAAKRAETARIMQATNTFFIEDDPYRELRFAGEDLPPITSYYRDTGFLLGSFSKIVSPGMRMGWIVAAPPLMERLIIAKQGADLHSNYLSQSIIYQYLQDNDLEAHIATIKAVYRRQRELMVAMIEETFPPEVQFTLPEGGMFLWLTLPPGLSAMSLFEAAKAQHVVFVPGHPFHTDGGGQNSLRLNFSNTDETKIEEGMKRLARALRGEIERLETRD
ncbi:MAG: PLP-dependent aminotransferase family protein [Ardenticatenaceae bacterium]|nr:PLP-dependent aminotransferase family protein [Ardenticatenaceae bacterium]